MFIDRYWKGSCQVVFLRVEPCEMIVSASKSTGNLTVLEGALVKMAFARVNGPKPKKGEEQKYFYDFRGCVPAECPNGGDDSGRGVRHVQTILDPQHDLKILWSADGAVVQLVLENSAEFATCEYGAWQLNIPIEGMERIPQQLRDRLKIAWENPYGENDKGVMHE